MGTNALNPGSGKGPRGAPHRGQVREGRGSRAARPGPTLRSLICFQEKPRLQPFGTCLPGADRNVQANPASCLAPASFPRYRSCPFSSQALLPDQEFSLPFFPFSHSHSIPLQGPDTKMVAVPQSHGIRFRGDASVYGGLSQTSLKGV